MWEYRVTAKFDNGETVTTTYPTLEQAERAMRAVLTLSGPNETAFTVQRVKKG